MGLQNEMINEAQVNEQWVGLIKETTDISEDSSVMGWLPKYLHYHALNENANATPANTLGMGGIRLPGQPNGQFGFGAQQAGSGDKPVSYLTMSMQIAAQTVGFNVVPVVPANSTLTYLTYLDVVYAGGKLDSTTQAPNMFEMGATLPADTMQGAILTFNDGTTDLMTGVYLGKSRLSGFPIIMVKTLDANESVNTAVTLGTTATSTDGTTTGAITNIGTPQFVRAYENHIAGFSGVLFSKLSAAATAADSVTAMKFAAQPYGREESEATHSRSLGMKFYNKAVEVEDWFVDIATTRQMIQDSQQFGFDVPAHAQKALVNEASQSINKNILSKVFGLGAKNAKAIYDSTSVHYNVNFDWTSGNGQTNFMLGYDSEGVLTEIVSPTAVPVAKTITGGETLHTAQVKILNQILGAADALGVRGRSEPGTGFVTNPQIGSMIKVMAGFQAIPFTSGVKVKTGLNQVGTIAGLNIFIDYNMPQNDTRICIFRKGNGSETGLIFMPYKLADIVSTIAESNMAPKWQLLSRAKLVEAGHNPEHSYLTIKVNTEYGLLR